MGIIWHWDDGGVWRTRGIIQVVVRSECMEPKAVKLLCLDTLYLRNYIYIYIFVFLRLYIFFIIRELIEVRNWTTQTHSKSAPRRTQIFF